jgi:hypothetical protein
MGHQSRESTHSLGHSSYWNFLYTSTTTSYNYLKIIPIFRDFYNYFAGTRYINFFRSTPDNNLKYRRPQLHFYIKSYKRVDKRVVALNQYVLSYYLLSYQGWFACFIFFYYSLYKTALNLNAEIKLFKNYLWLYTYSKISY